MIDRLLRQQTSIFLAETYPGADYTDEEIEFLMAIERYKRVERKPFPTWSEVLGVLRGLGWRKQTDKETRRQGDKVTR